MRFDRVSVFSTVRVYRKVEGLAIIFLLTKTAFITTCVELHLYKTLRPHVTASGIGGIAEVTELASSYFKSGAAGSPKPHGAAENKNILCYFSENKGIIKKIAYIIFEKQRNGGFFFDSSRNVDGKRANDAFSLRVSFAEYERQTETDRNV